MARAARMVGSPRLLPAAAELTNKRLARGKRLSPEQLFKSIR